MRRYMKHFGLFQGHARTESKGENLRGPRTHQTEGSSGWHLGIDSPATLGVVWLLSAWGGMFTRKALGRRRMELLLAEQKKVARRTSLAVPWEAPGIPQKERLARLISHIHCASGYKQYCVVGNTASQCKLGFFKMLILQVTWQIQNQRQEEFCVFSEATRLFQLGGLVRNRLL